MSWIERTKKEREENIKLTIQLRSEHEKLLRELYEDIWRHGELEKTRQIVFNKDFWVYVRTSRGRRFVLKCVYPSKVEICEVASGVGLEAPEESLGTFFDSDILSDLYDLVIADAARSNVRKYEESTQKIRDRLGRL